MTTLLFFAHTAALNWALYLLIAGALFLVTKNRPVSYAFTVFYLSLVGQDTAIYYFGNTVFERGHLSLIQPYSLRGFLSVPAALMVVCFLALAIALTISLRKTLGTLTVSTVLKCAGVVVFLTAFSIPDTYSKMRHAFTFDAVARSVAKVQAEQLKYCTQNSLLNFVDEMLFRRASVPLRVTDHYAEHKDTIAAFRLPIGERNYKRLGLKPFRKIFLFASESLSSDLLSGYNNALDVDNASFSDNPHIRDLNFNNYRTSHQPTLPGLVAMFNSHPNFDVLMESKAVGFPNSLVQILKGNGYRTYFVRSASKYFSNENVHFKNLGFETIVAREEFEQTHPRYISGWGVADRIVYDEVLSLLERHRDEKLFITILGTDTHPLDGRADYFDLEYPKLEGDYGRYGISAKFLQAVGRHNHDLNRFLDLAKNMGVSGEDTLFVFTADHGCPLNNVVSNIPGYEKKSLARIPLIFHSAQKLPAVDRDTLSSQIDFAPTLLHLLNLRIPAGYWGESLFSDEKRDSYVGYVQGKYYLEFGDEKHVIPDAEPSGEYAGFLSLAGTLIVDKELNKTAR